MTNFPFLKRVAQKNKPIVMSVGASYLSEIEEAVRFLNENGSDDLTLLHCVLSYPTNYDDANLNFITHLKSVFPMCRVGYSDHTPPDPNMIVLTTAFLLGATVIEKHFTLDKTLNGNDHYHAGDPDDFKKAVANFDLINKILGSSYKTVLDCERIPRREARRSIFTARDLQKGDRIKEKDLICKRPGTGLPPKYFDLVVGSTVNTELAEDSLLSLNDLVDFLE